MILVKKKELYPYFIYSSAGRWESKEIAINKTPRKDGQRWIGDCAVRAIVHATGEEYQVVKRSIKRLGYSKIWGWDGRMFDFFNNYTFFSCVAHPVKDKIWGRGKTTTLKNFLDVHPKGVYILRTSNFHNWGHLICIKNGKVFDTFIEDMWVTNAWEVQVVVD